MSDDSNTRGDEMVENYECPTCGAEHETFEALVEHGQGGCDG